MTNHQLLGVPLAASPDRSIFSSMPVGACYLMAVMPYRVLVVHDVKVVVPGTYDSISVRKCC